MCSLYRLGRARGKQAAHVNYSETTSETQERSFTAGLFVHQEITPPSFSTICEQPTRERVMARLRLDRKPSQ
jgi:hypothetical protein